MERRREEASEVEAGGSEESREDVEDSGGSVAVPAGGADSGGEAVTTSEEDVLSSSEEPAAESLGNNSITFQGGFGLPTEGSGGGKATSKGDWIKVKKKGKDVLDNRVSNPPVSSQEPSRVLKLSCPL